jgi:hypothetical protein
MSHGCRRLALAFPHSFLFSAASYSQTAVFERLLQIYYPLDLKRPMNSIADQRGRSTEPAGQGSRLSTYILAQYVIEDIAPAKITMSRNHRLQSLSKRSNKLPLQFHAMLAKLLEKFE